METNARKQRADKPQGNGVCLGITDFYRASWPIVVTGAGFFVNERSYLLLLTAFSFSRLVLTFSFGRAGEISVLFMLRIRMELGRS